MKKFLKISAIIAFLAIAGIAGCAALIGGAASSIDKSIKSDTAAAIKDVTITKCVVAHTVLGDYPTAKIKVTNSAKKTQDYLSIEITFLNTNGDVLTNGYSDVNALAPGKFHVASVEGTDTTPASAKITCKVTDATAVEK